MIDLDFEFTSKLWEYSGKGSWHFVSVPKEISADIKTFTRHNARGFRTVRVKVKIGNQEWLTSLFPDKKSDCYFLPVKASVRKAESIMDGSTVHAKITILI